MSVFFYKVKQQEWFVIEQLLQKKHPIEDNWVLKC